jgi:hypothetical protein
VISALLEGVIMKTKLLGFIACVALLGALSVRAAHADTIFDISLATFGDCVGDTCTGAPPPSDVSITGTLTINTVTGTVDSTFLRVNGYPLMGANSVFAGSLSVTTVSPSEVEVTVSNVTGTAVIGFSFTTTPTPGSLVDFTSGLITSSAFEFDPLTISGDAPLYFNLIQYNGEVGNITAEVQSATPLPAALPLFATGLGGFGRCWGKSRHGRMESKTTRMTQSGA